MKPNGKRVAVVDDDAPDKEKGFIVAEEELNDVVSGTVIAVSDGWREFGVWCESKLNVGDRVLYMRGAGLRNIEAGGERFRLISDPDEILVVLGGEV